MKLDVVITATLVLLSMGVIFGLILAIASRLLRIESDPKIGEITAVLPGANCGACGYAGCSGLAEAIVSGIAPINACPVGKAACAEKIAAIMGLELTAEIKPKNAHLVCQGGKSERVERFWYMGIADCAAADMLNGGPKLCEFGCLGLGNCVRACLFDAIRINENGLPEIDPELCTGCGACVRTCPRQLIKLIDDSYRVMVLCKSHSKGPDVRKACKIGCIGCGICAKNCPAEAIKITNSLAEINPELCTACGICIEKCPMKTIRSIINIHSKPESEKQDSEVKVI
ncbi:MAG TPA: Fe-S cluster domain-containing protein [Bacillota bacterium]|jgi:electron transport complex protein RnfB|nr:Fe-S cluster domain-containing protein [Bacillota bacterium]HOL08546.1 Fe-S cluster domain-containing protein [Bacillota bacterium]HPO96973.1 Fe-S cluster domain-containing protein [Bacillota bacterium]